MERGESRYPPLRSARPDISSLVHGSNGARNQSTGAHCHPDSMREAPLRLSHSPRRFEIAIRAHLGVRPARYRKASLIDQNIMVFQTGLKLETPAAHAIQRLPPGQICIQILVRTTFEPLQLICFTQ